MQRQHFYGPVQHVSAHQVETHVWTETQPPDDPAMSRECPQCRRLTWRYSRHCVHCQLDFQAWESRQQWLRWGARFAAIGRAFGVAERG